MFTIEQFPEEQTGVRTLQTAPTIHEGCRVVKSQLGAWTELGPGTTFNEVRFGDYSYTAGNVNIAYASIGKFCSIANGVRINPGNHPQWRVSQHHFSYRRQKYALNDHDDEEFFNWRRKQDCSLGHDVWIGHGALVMPGVKIATGAVIGAGAVVTKDVGPYEVAVGVPARVIKKRFPESVIEKMLRVAWWNWSRRELEERWSDFNDLEQFFKKYDQ